MILPGIASLWFVTVLPQPRKGDCDWMGRNVLLVDGGVKFLHDPT